MTNNYAFNNQAKSNPYKWVYIIMLFISFIWISIYPASTAMAGNLYFAYGNLFDMASGNLSSFIVMILAEALVMWLGFEIIFYLYRWLLGFKIYSFIVPADKMKSESRLFFIYRNVFYGIIVNLCFLFPYLQVYLPFFDLVITLITLISFAAHLNKTYAEPIIGHFVFKCFCYPVFVYEALVVLSQVLEVLAWER